MAASELLTPHLEVWHLLKKVILEGDAYFDMSVKKRMAYLRPGVYLKKIGIYHAISGNL